MKDGYDPLYDPEETHIFRSTGAALPQPARRATGRYDYDGDRIGVRGRHMWYGTVNGCWHVDCTLRRLPGGNFLSGSATKFIGSDHNKNDYNVSWSMLPDWHGVKRVAFHSEAHVPEYVKEICYRIGKRMDAKFHPDYGTLISDEDTDYTFLAGGNSGGKTLRGEILTAHRRNRNET